MRAMAHACMQCIARTSPAERAHMERTKKPWDGREVVREIEANAALS